MRSCRVWLVAACAVVVCSTVALHTQNVRYNSGQTIAPVFEGWEPNDDGSFSMVFGYMNRNYEEILDVPVGPNNKFEPGGVDQGQPTYFFPRRQQFMFKVRVPKDWGNKDLVWTLTHRGHTEKAYATLKGFWEINNNVYHQNRSGPGRQGEPNTGPKATLVGPPTRTIQLSESVPLEVAVVDDGLPRAAGRGGAPVAGAARGAQTPPAGAGAQPAAAARGGTPAAEAGRGGAQTVGGAAQGRAAAAPLPSVIPPRQYPITQMVVRLDAGMRLGVIWVLHRRSGQGNVTFSPSKVAVVDGRASTTARFSEPGTYVLRGYADDGILLDSVEVRVTVTAR